MIKFFKKTIIGYIIFSILTVSSSYALGPIATTIAEGVVKVATDVIKNIMEEQKKDRGSIVLSHTTLLNNVKIEKSTLVLSNVGIDISGKNIKISEGLMKNKVKLFKVNAYFSNLGIKLASNGDIIVSNSKLLNTVTANDSTLVGANAGIKIQGK